MKSLGSFACLHSAASSWATAQTVGPLQLQEKPIVSEERSGDAAVDSQQGEREAGWRERMKLAELG